MLQAGKSKVITHSLSNKKSNLTKKIGKSLSLIKFTEVFHIDIPDVKHVAYFEVGFLTENLKVVPSPSLE